MKDCMQMLRINREKLVSADEKPVIRHYEHLMCGNGVEEPIIPAEPFPLRPHAEQREWRFII